MRIATNISLREYLRTGIIWHVDLDSKFCKGVTLLKGLGIRRDMIGHPIPPGAAAGIAQLYVSGDSAEDFSGVILFRS